MGAEARTIDLSATTLELEETPRETRFLYADSEPFPHDFDFIAALTGFVELSCAVLTGVREARSLDAELAEARGALAQRVAALDALLSNVAHAVAPSSPVAGEPFLTSTVQRLERSAEDAVASARAELERSFESQRARFDQAHARILHAMVHATSHFLSTCELEVLSQDFRAELSDAGYSVQLTQRVTGEIGVTFDVDAARTAWSSPRKVSDLVGALHVAVGPRRSWLTRSLSMEMRALDEYVIGSVRLEGDVADVRLRKRRDAPDTLSIHFALLNGQVQCQIVRAEDPGAVHDVAPEHREPLEALWRALVDASRVEHAARAGLRALTIDGEDALHAHGAELLVDRLVGVYGPIVAEVSKRGRSARELCLKRNVAPGVREERFVDRATLLAPLDALEPHERARLAALHLTPPRSMFAPSIPVEMRSSLMPPPIPANAQTDRG